MRKRILSILLIAMMVLSISACGTTKETEETEGTKGTKETEEANEGELETITMALSADMVTYTELVEEPLKELGYKLELTIFDDYVMPNQALVEGSVQCNFFQHEVYLDTFNESNGTDLVMVKPAFILNPYGIYSEKISSLDEVSDGMLVAIPNNPSNRERALNVLQAAGLLTLADTPADGEYFAVADIVDNPKNLQFTEVENLSMYAMLGDVDMIILSCQTILDQGGDASSDLFRMEEERYKCGIVVNAGDENEEWVKALLEAFQTEEFENAVAEKYPGVAIYE